MLTSEISFYLLATAYFVLLLEKAIFLTAKINIMYTRFLLDWLICKHISLHWKNTVEKLTDGQYLSHTVKPYLRTCHWSSFFQNHWESILIYQSKV